MRNQIGLFVLAVCVCCVIACASKQTTSFDELLQLVQSFDGTLQVERERKPIGELSARILSYEVDGLKQYALNVTPAGSKPQAGWPVLVFNHGYVPEPAQHGMRKSTGKRDRPGDYYRGIPKEFARNGFMVIAPDYRGHAESDGGEYTRDSEPLRPLQWYSRDVVALVKALESLPEVDRSNVFLLGHSMGGGITLNALAAMPDEIRAASVWSTSRSSYFPFRKASSQVSFADIKSPLNIHHAKADPVTPIENAIELRAGVYPGNAGDVYQYDSDKHLFQAENLRRAFDADLAFFNSFLQ